MLETIGFILICVLLYVGLCPVWHWVDKQDQEYLLKKENYIAWLYQSYYVYDQDDLEYLLDDEDVFEKYLKEHKLPWNSELHG